MSQLESVAGNLRAFANDASPLSANVGSSARQLTVIGKEAESLSRNGVNLNRLLSAIHVAQKAAESAASAAEQVRTEGVAWADHLASGGVGQVGTASGTSLPPTSGAAFVPSLTQPAGFPADVVMVPLSLINDSATSVNGAGDFRKGYSPADLEWAHTAFISVVMPGIANGATLDDFSALDQREGRMGVQSYSDTYSGFFGDSKIMLDTNGSNFTVANGYHRIWVARRMGLDAVPAAVSGHRAR